MSSLVGGTGIIGQDMVCGFSNGKYKTFEGTEIVAENCVKAKVKDLVAEGKTYQNLLTNKINYTFSGSAFYYNKTTLNNGAIYTRNNKEITSGASGTYITFKCHTVASMLKSNTTYTLAFNIESTFSDYKGITVSGENDCYFKSSTSESNKTRYFHDESFDLSTGYKKIMFKTNPNITKYFGFGFPPMQSQSEGNYLKITNIILLEGDYITTELPEINGIESVSEKENNVLSVKINDNTTTLNLPIPLRSLPNSTCDTIEGNKLMQKVGKVVLDGSESNISIENQTEDYTRVFMNTVLNKKAVAPSVGFCNELLYEAIHKNTYEHIYATGYSVWVFIKTANLTSNNIDGVKTYLKNNPVTIYYELAEPIIHDLEIPQLNISKGTNVITTENNIKPKLSMKVKVKK